MTEDFDYCETILYPFTLNIKRSGSKIISQCQQIPGIILQHDSIEELKAEFVRILDGWFEVSKEEPKK